MRSPYRNMEVVVPRDHLTQEPQLVPLLFMHAKSAWNTGGHPGWGLYKYNDTTSTQMPTADAQQYGVNSQQVPCFTPTEYAGDVVRAAVGGSGATSPGGTRLSDADAVMSPAHPSTSRGAADVVMADGKRSSSPASGGRRSPEIEAQRRAQLQSIFRPGAAREASAAAAAASPPPTTAQGLSSLGLSADVQWSQLSLPGVDFAPPPPGANWMDTNAMAAQTPATGGGVGGGSAAAGLFAGAGPNVPPLFGGTAGAGRADSGDNGGLVRLRSSLGSAALDVARPDKQRMRAGDQDGVEVRCAPGPTRLPQPATAYGRVCVARCGAWCASGRVQTAGGDGVGGVQA